MTDAIHARLAERFGPQSRINTEQDPYGGVRIQIISEEFSEMNNAERREAVLNIVDDSDIAALQLLSPTEPIPAIEKVESLPVWSETLADSRHRETIQVSFASQAQEQLTPPIVTTFYSLRGGVGRSTALAHTAFDLVASGLSVLCIDMDLEAPGLAALLGVEADAEESRGVVRILTDLEMGGQVDDTITNDFVRVPTPDANQRLELLPAGTPSASYARDLALLDPEAWYREDINPLRDLIDGIRDLPEELRPDVILIDSRTGLSPIAAPLIFDVADAAIVAFYPHPQARVGTSLLTRAILTANTARSHRENRPLTPEIRFVVSPAPASEDGIARTTERALNWVSEWLAPARDASGAKPFDDLEEILHVVPYSEEAASSDSATNSSSHAPYRPIAEWILGMVSPDANGVEHSKTSSIPKTEILDELDFSSQTADGRDEQELREIFVGTESVTRALTPEARLVVGRKGTGKTLLFRQSLASMSGQGVAVTAPPGTGVGLPLDASTYAEIEKSVQLAETSWETAWRAIAMLALLADGRVEAPFDMTDLRATPGERYRATDLVSDIRSIMGMPDRELILRDWLDDFDDEIAKPVYLLFDALDTGFGNDRELRNKSVTGLMLLVNGQARQLRNLRFKTFLREDIFRAIDIPNKSHLRAESVVLAWTDQFDYLRIAIRQAWRSPEFRQLVSASRDDKNHLPGLRRPFEFTTEIEYWPDEIVLSVWRLLVGERMSGGKTAFTHNWVWARLADANDDHAPRHLVALLADAVSAEMRLEPGNPFTRSLIRPRALADALDGVSENAVEAVEEEFPELEPVLTRLRSIGRTPFDASEIESEIGTDSLDLASEVGVLARGVDSRYRVPELYRRALNMTRQGQQ